MTLSSLFRLKVAGITAAIAVAVTAFSNPTALYRSSRSFRSLQHRLSAATPIPDHEFKPLLADLDRIFTTDESSKSKQKSPNEISKHYRRNPEDDTTMTIPNAQAVVFLLEQRYNARGNATLVRDLNRQLVKQHGIRVYDNPNYWTTSKQPPRSHRRKQWEQQQLELKRRYGPCRHPYVQVGSRLDPMFCPLTMTQIHSRLSQATICRQTGNYEQADAIDFELNIHGVHCNHTLMTWRADGRNGDESGATAQRKREPLRAMVYTPTDLHPRIPGGTNQTALLQRVNQLLELRSEAIVREETTRVKFLTFELYETYDVSVDDNSHTWSVGGVMEPPPTLPDREDSPIHKAAPSIFPLLFDEDEVLYNSPSYRQSLHSRPVSNELVLDRILQLVQERIHKREEHKFLEADALRNELWKTYYVGVNDRLRQWSVGGVYEGK